MPNYFALRAKWCVLWVQNSFSTKQRAQAMNLQKISYTEFSNRFKPQTNHLQSKNDPDLIQFETYGEDIDYVRTKVAERRVWTACDVDGEFFVVSGLSHVNRLYYFVCEVPYGDSDEFEVFDD